MNASEELEQSATKFALEAVKLDNSGAKGMAITMYQKAIEVLLKLTQLYPEYQLNKVYIQRALAYQERIKVLQGSVPSVPTSSESKVVHDTSNTEDAASYEELIIKEKPNVTWGEVIGLEQAKRAIKEAIVYPVQRPDLFPLGWPRGILLFGPPGCGKTLLAAAVATEISANFLSVDAASIISKWLGEGEQNVAKLFSSSRKWAQEGTPAIIFIDELDSLMGKHSNEVGGEVRVRNQFLKEMDGVIDKGKKLHIYIIGATNKPWDLDWPFIRRFQKRILVPLPDRNARLKISRFYTKNLDLSSAVDLLEFARLSEGFSGSDIKDICQAVHLRVIGDFFESGKAHDEKAKPRQLMKADFTRTISERKPSVSPDMLTLYNRWSDAFKAL
jgi:SpoVK/Ycf46/Vps4 family AAA+-type ATPase